MARRRSSTFLVLPLLSLGVLTGCQGAQESPAERSERPKEAKQKEAAPLDPRLVQNAAEERLAAEAIGWARLLETTPEPEKAGTGPTNGPFEEQLTRLLLAEQSARTWAAFGLGRACAARPATVEPGLTVTSGVWSAAEPPPSEEELRVLGIAIGSCQTRSAEATLTGWLAPSPAADADRLIRAAAAGLGTLAELTGTLSEGSQAALLDAAAARKDPFLLYPLSRLRNLPEAVSERLLEVAGSILVEERPGGRALAILALGGAQGSLSAPALLQILVSGGFSPTERSAAAHALARLGGPGQAALDEVTNTLLARGVPSTTSDPLWSPLRATLEALDEPKQSAGELRKLAALPIAERSDAPNAALRRRMIWLRCRAADLLARDRIQSVTLNKCDPDSGLLLELSLVRVLARSRIELERRKVWDQRLESEHPQVVQAALRLIAGHVELGDVRAPLERALSAEATGTRATAAKILAAYPARAHDPKHPEAGPDPRIVTALKAILEASGTSIPEETVAAAIGAAAALSTLALRPLIEVHCRGGRPALRDAAARALSMLGTPGQRCQAASHRPEASAPAPAPESTLTLAFQSDVGPLRLVLDRPATGVARGWIEQRAKSGELTRGPVHAVSPGFSVMFGDADGDGFEGPLPAMSGPLEVAPWDFPAGAVSLSSFSPGAFGNQLLIGLEPLPALVGRRVLLGHAEGPWHLLWPGDRLEPASPSPP